MNKLTVYAWIAISFMTILYLYSSCNKESVNNEIRHSISEISPENPFVSFDMRLTRDNIDCLDNIKIIQGYDECNNYGDLDNFKNELNAFFQSLGNEIESSEIAAKLISNLVNQIIAASQKETAWVTLRVSTSTRAYDVPRWHTDGYFYDLGLEQKSEQYKIVMVLKGPQTLFYNLPTEMRSEFNSLCRDDDREALAKMLDISKAISVKPYHGAIFVVGADYAAVHSEPPIHEDRLFLSILPGSKKQIKELYDRWHSDKE